MTTLRSMAAGRVPEFTVYGVLSSKNKPQRVNAPPQDTTTFGHPVQVPVAADVVMGYRINWLRHSVANICEILPLKTTVLSGQRSWCISPHFLLTS